MNPATGATVLPSVARFERVQTILEGEAIFKDRLGPSDQQIITKRNQEKHLFSRGVIAVTISLQRKGLDPHSVDRYVVLKEAVAVIEDIEKRGDAAMPVLPAPPAKEEPAPKPKAQAKPAPKPKAVKPPAPPAPPKPKPIPKPKPKAEPVKVAKPKAKPPVKAVAATKAVHAEPAMPLAKAPPEPSAPPEAAKPQASAKSDQVTVYHIFPTVFSLLTSGAHLLEMADNQPGAEQRLSKLHGLIEDVYELKDVAVPLPIDMLPPSLTDAQTSGSSSSAKG